MIRFVRYRRAIVRFLAMTVAAGALGLAGTPGPAHAAVPGCLVNYRVLSASPAGFSAEITFVNLGDPVASWAMFWQMNPGEHLAVAWNASIVQSGAWILATDAPGNGSLPAGASASFGWSASATTVTTAPTAFWMNGTPCSIAPTA